MPNTVRTQSAILALLADNTTQDISPQDHRDAEVSKAVYGAIYVEDGVTAQTGIGTSATLVTAFNTAQGVDGAAANVIPAKASNKLTVGTGGDGVYRIDWALSLTALTASTQYIFEIRVGGALTNYKQEINTNATPDDVAVSGSGIVSGLSAADDIELYVVCDAASKAMTPTNAVLMAQRLA